MYLLTLILSNRGILLGEWPGEEWNSSSFVMVRGGGVEGRGRGGSRETGVIVPLWYKGGCNQSFVILVTSYLANTQANSSTYT